MRDGDDNVEQVPSSFWNNWFFVRRAVVWYVEGKCMNSWQDAQKGPSSKAAGKSNPEAYPRGRTVRRIRSTKSVRAAESVRRPGPR